MSRLDVVKSLLRSAARAPGTQLARLRPPSRLRERLKSLIGRRLWLSDRKLTAAVARVPEVAAATVSSGAGKLRIDASFHDGTTLLVALTPLRAAFAPRGAKEVSLRAEPESAALHPRCADIVAAIATEVALALWGPFLRAHNKGNGRRALAHRHGDVLVVDLRSVPAVRAALGQPLLAAAIEALSLRSLQVDPGGLRLAPSLAGIDVPADF
jgi:hypothetical protein